jgi:hypothetical protein
MEARDSAERLLVNAFQTLQYYGALMLSTTSPFLSLRVHVRVYKKHLHRFFIF